MKLFWFGIISSIVYAILLVAGIHFYNLKMMTTWNEFGDFLAGLFSPLAFLWLVLGYLQQQKELQQNTHALTLQAEELKNSVDQYKAMVEVAKEQLLTDREMILSAKQEKEAQYKPRIKAPKIEPTMRIGNQEVIYNGSVENAGSNAVAFHIETIPPFRLYNGLSFHSLKEGVTLGRQSVSEQIKDLPEKITVIMKYESVLGIPYVDTYFYEHQGAGRYSVVSFKEI
ncbi:hypothetical protein ACP26F_08445 [Franconibacter pulveris 1160]|uniref:hypothetical protein n=1 Tax=Franconibacter pulveris TaxID=435910 RepID=UPI000464ACAA|nr:hypothetical protein [Franconibacter pulveris]